MIQAKFKENHKTKISIIIPTYNRADLIKDTLACLRKQEVGPAADYEVIVVDNNSNDHTEKTVKSCFPWFSRKFQYYFEVRQGSAYALNLGIGKATGEIITCLDDDCLVENNYVQNICDEFQKAGEEIGFIGGKILPHWLGGKIPNWLNEFLPGNPGRKLNDDGTNEFFCGPLGILDYGDQPFVLEPNPNGDYPKLFYGANLSFRRNLFEQWGEFSEKSLLVEDTEMCLRLLNSDVKAMYSPKIKVFHKIKTV